MLRKQINFLIFNKTFILDPVDSYYYDMFLLNINQMKIVNHFSDFVIQSDIYK